MPNIRRHKRTASAGLVSIVLHLLLALLAGVQFNWRFHRPIVTETAIQVTFYPGENAPPMRDRPALKPTATERQNDTLQEPVRKHTDSTAHERANKPESKPSIPLVAAAVAGTPIPTEAALESETPTALVSPNDLMLSEEGALSGPSTESDSPSAGELASSEAAEGSAEGIPGPTIGEQMHDAIVGVASQMVAGNGSGYLDVVFLLDTSGSMYDNILAVSQELSTLASIFEQHGLDYRVGLVKFKSALSSLRIFPLSKDITQFQRVLRNTTRVGGPERAYDAIVEATKRVKFREGAERHFVLVTDEPLSGSYTYSEVWRICEEAGIHVSVIGLRDVFHRQLAGATGGTWQPIPVSP